MTARVPAALTKARTPAPPCRCRSTRRCTRTRCFAAGPSRSRYASLQRLSNGSLTPREGWALSATAGGSPQTTNSTPHHITPPPHPRPLRQFNSQVVKFDGSTEVLTVCEGDAVRDVKRRLTDSMQVKRSHVKRSHSCRQNTVTHAGTSKTQSLVPADSPRAGMQHSVAHRATAHAEDHAEPFLPTGRDRVRE